MAVEKYITLEDYQDDVVAYIDVYLSRANLAQQIKYKVIGDEKAKKPVNFKITPDFVKFDTNVDLYVIVNHAVFEGLEGEDKVILVDEALFGLYLDDKTERLKNSLDTIGVATSKKHGADNVLRAKELAEKIYEQNKDKNKNK